MFSSLVLSFVLMAGCDGTCGRPLQNVGSAVVKVVDRIIPDHHQCCKSSPKTKTCRVKARRRSKCCH